MIGELQQTLSRSANVLSQTQNARRPLLQLPAETLNHIISLIPNPIWRSNLSMVTLKPYWHSQATDILTLVPMSQTCRRLREIILGNPLLWRHGYTQGRSSTIPVFLSRSGRVPLTLFLSEGDAVPTLSLLRLTAEISRVQELHLYGLQPETSFRITANLHMVWPELEYLSISPKYHPQLDLGYFRQERLPNLRYLHLRSLWMLPSTGFSTLTHLSLSSIANEGYHAPLVSFLSACPNIISVMLENLNRDVPPPLPSYPNILPRLQRALLYNMNDSARDFFYPLFALHDRSDFALQLLWPEPSNRTFSLEDVIPRRAQGGVSLLAIGRHPPREDLMSRHWWHKFFPSLTAVGRTTTVRVAGSGFIFSEIRRILTSAGNDALADVRELWLMNMEELTDNEGDVLPLAFASLPALRTATIVVDRSSYPDAVPTLRMLPRISQRPPMDSVRLETLCLVHGFSDYRPATSATELGTMYYTAKPAQAKLDLSQMLIELESGEYDLPETLCLQTPEQLPVDEGQLGTLRELFRGEVRVECIDALPKLPLPGYCVEPAAGFQFPASMW
ncbi:hypothetical protein C8Q74DRAFT_147316 [Fomes fomentarius]|nr:hypothetical protein C8Q74DRAFT_147316 [Fomes fomentarius]